MTQQTVTIVLGDDRYELDHAAAAALLDRLWSGEHRGAVIAAARLSEALAGPDTPEPGAVVFASYELAAVRHGLGTVDVGTVSPAER